LGPLDALIAVSDHVETVIKYVRLRFPEGSRDYSLIQSVQTGVGTDPACCLMGIRGVKRPAREAAHPPLSSAEVKNELPIFATRIYKMYLKFLGSDPTR